ncbi:MAG: hypothetical protein J3T61_06425 [Candidatus Brocadiales bacterium]|nr:hypothetical protein [Candidatus Bathyanammoxibius sp.]
MLLEPFFGNAAQISAGHRGWFLGHFMEESGKPLHTRALEIKWGLHRKGETRADWDPEGSSTTLTLLIRGEFEVKFSDRQFTLNEEGDFVLWGPGIPHTWAALDNSLILTVRWPSSPTKER